MRFLWVPLPRGGRGHGFVRRQTPPAVRICKSFPKPFQSRHQPKLTALPSPTLQVATIRRQRTGDSRLGVSSAHWEVPRYTSALSSPNSDFEFLSGFPDITQGRPAWFRRWNPVSVRDPRFILGGHDPGSSTSEGVGKRSRDLRRS